MALKSSDVNKKVRFINNPYGLQEGRLLSLSADQKTAFVEWDAFSGKGKREAVDAQLLKTIPEKAKKKVVDWASRT